MNGPTYLAPQVEIVYPDRDGQPMAETGIHVAVLVTLIATLRHYFRHRSDVYVTGNIFLYYEENHPEKRKSPDVMVVKGVDAGPERRSFKTWEERAVPSFVLEITSKETAEEDREAKRQVYERLGIREYFLFDPLHEYLEQPLLGYRLIGEEYEPLPPAADGGLLSAELGVRMVPEEASLGLFHFRTGDRVPTPPELSRLLEVARTQVEEAEQRASEAERRANEAEQRLEEERRQREELEKELARLRAAQAPEQGEAGPGPS